MWQGVWKSAHSQTFLFIIYLGSKISIFPKNSERFYRCNLRSIGVSTPSGTASTWNTYTSLVSDLAVHEKVLDRDLHMPVMSYIYINVSQVRI
jgi:hypothetical protein